MTWLLALGPLVIVGVAVWLVIGSGRLNRLRTALATERRDLSSSAVERLGESVAELDRELAGFGQATAADDDTGPAER